MKLLCITPVEQIEGFSNRLQDNFETFFLHRPTKTEVRQELIKSHQQIIFTNPNQQGFKIDESLLKDTFVHTICTASTGINHIDVQYCESKKIRIFSITKELETLKKITSTAEHAFCLLLTSVRKIIPANESVTRGEWSWEPYIGRQIKDLKIGVIGYGRLGKMFSEYCDSFGSDVTVYDPYVSVPDKYRVSNSLEDIFSSCDAISLHVHVNNETRHMINDKVLDKSKKDLIIINTSRGEIVSEKAIKEAILKGKISHYACDVLENEFEENLTSLLFSLPSSKVTITPHIGGSTIDAQKIAYNRVLDLLINSTGEKGIS